MPGLRGAVPRLTRIRYRGLTAEGAADRAHRRRLPRPRGAARMRPSRRHALSSAHDRSAPARVQRGGRALPDRPRGAPAARRNRTTDQNATGAALIEAMLPDVPFDGWSRCAAATAARRSAGMRAISRRSFPAARATSSRFSRWADRARWTTLAGATSGDEGARARRRRRADAADAARAPSRGGAAGAVAAGLPQNAALGPRLLYDTVDAIWYAAGDTATDFNFYTKRGLLPASMPRPRSTGSTTARPGRPTRGLPRPPPRRVMALPRLGARLRQGFGRLPNPLRLMRAARRS